MSPPAAERWLVSFIRSMIAASVFAAVVLSPSVASAAEEQLSIVPRWLPLVTGAVGLGIAVALLLEVIAFSKLAHGAAISGNISYVATGVVCLAASALVQWISNFLPSITVGQAVLASNLLVAASMALLILYFAGVRRKMKDYMRDMNRDGVSMRPDGGENRG